MYNIILIIHFCGEFLLKYTTGLKTKSFWFLESKKVANLILEDYSKKEILEVALEDNIFQVESETRVKEIVNWLYKCLNAFPKEILEYFLQTTTDSAKIFVLVTILKNDKLFFEFMYEVFREHILLRDFKLKNKDFDMFFDDKAYQSEIISNWSETTISRLQRAYRTMLSEAGVLDTSSKDNLIKIPFIDLKLNELLVNSGFGPYLYSITGEK